MASRATAKREPQTLRAAGPARPRFLHCICFSLRAKARRREKTRLNSPVPSKTNEAGSGTDRGGPDEPSLMKALP